MTVRPSKKLYGKGITGNKNSAAFSSQILEQDYEMLMPGFKIGVP